MVIHSICDHLDVIPTIAQWHWREWGDADPDGSLQTWTAGLESRTERDAVPTIFVAFAQDEPIGSVVLVENDMRSHPELSPWLAGLYVVPAQRRSGVGTALTQHAMDQAFGFGVSSLFLHTASAASLYARLGWVSKYRERYEGNDVDVMEYHA